MDVLLAAYLPQDRRQALARGTMLPEHITGAALLADISGFTPLTEALDRMLGARRGGEELTRLINQVYNALIAQIDHFGGSVIGFAGDGITCWFAEALHQGQAPAVPAGIAGTTDDRRDSMNAAQETILRAVVCALALQEAMRAITDIPLSTGITSALALKVAVASGSARRFVLGNPAIQLLDVLAGASLVRMAAGEHLAANGEVLLDEPTVVALGDHIQVDAWRADPEMGARFAVIKNGSIDQTILNGIDALNIHPQELPLSEPLLRPWLLPAVYDHHQAGLGDFLTELRPVVTLFLRFSGIDYDGDPNAGSKLDGFVRRVQLTLSRYEGTLLQITTGDKGSYLYAAFGAPISHEDDPHRAAHAALEWLALPDMLDFLQPLQIGISRGVMRTGAYGADTRKTYGVLGDEVNLAARLMSHAALGEALVSGRMQTVLATDFVLEPLEPIPLKGMPEPLPIFRLVGTRARAVRLPEPVYALPMVGRAAELALIGERADRALAGHGQVVGIVAEAGMGKSRLLAEIIRIARRSGLRGFGGACQSYGTNTPYLVWEPILRAFFDLDHDMPARRQIRALEAAVNDWAPDRVQALPLLGSLLGLNLPENDFTQHLEPQYRQSALEALLLDCLTAAAREAQADRSGLLLVLEDMHWSDALSHALLERIAQASRELPMLIVLAYRPPELLRLQAPRIEALSHFTRVELAPLTEAEVAQAIRAKLVQLLPERKGAASPALIARITAKTQGNPFYVEELLNYLRDRGIDPHDTAALTQIDLPSSMHTLILSRIDQLGAQQQAILKVASVIGRLFRFAHLHGAYPVLGSPTLLKSNLDELAMLDLTPLDTPEPELAYLFKHIVTQEVAYESLTMQVRAGLHEQLAAYLEQLAGDDTEQLIDLLAYHYERSSNLAKKRYYLHRAGEVAAARFANDAALAYLSRALDLTPEDALDERYKLLCAREQIYELQGERNLQAANLAIIEQLGAMSGDGRQGEVAVLKARYAVRTGDYAGAIVAAASAVALAVSMPTVAMDGYFWWAWALTMQGKYAAAREKADANLTLARAIGDRLGERKALNILGLVAFSQGNAVVARPYFEQSLDLCRAAHDRYREGNALVNLGHVAAIQGDFISAQAYYRQSMEIARATGDRRLEGNTHNAAGNIASNLGEYTTAQEHYEQALHILRQIGDRSAESVALNNLSLLAHRSDDNSRAQIYSQQAIDITRAIGDRDSEAYALNTMGHALLGLGQPGAAAAFYQAALNLRRELEQPNLAADPLAGLARVALASGNTVQARSHVEAILAYLGGGGTLEGTDELLRLWLTCYRVLQASDDARAESLLTQAYTLLQTQAAQLPDAATRRRFLEQVPDHREIIAAWRATQEQPPADAP